MKNESMYQFLSLSGLDLLVATKLKEAEIVLYNQNGEASEGLEGIREDFKKEMYSRHYLTALEYLRYCKDPLKKVFPKVMTSCPDDYWPLVLLFTAYTQTASSKLDAPIWPFVSPHYEKLNSVFSYEEFDQMQSTVTELLITFKKEAEICQIDFLKDRSVEKQEEEFAEEFITDIAEGFKTGNQDQVFKNYGNDKSKSMLMSWYGRDKLHQIIASPVERLFTTLLKLLLYLDLLHHAGYINRSRTDEIDDIQWSKIC